MEKLITLRFQGKCSSCGKTIPAGDRAVWRGHGKGIMHRQCESTKEIEKPKTEREGMDVFTIDYAEMRQAWHTFQTNPEKVYTHNPGGIIDLTSAWAQINGRWSGCTLDEMREFLRDGYRVEGLDGITSLTPSRPRRRLKFAEEGDELHLDLAWSGVDEPFSEWEKRMSNPGLSVEIHSDFSAHVPAKTIVQFQRWVARALQTLDENGVDMEVNIVYPCNNLWQESPRLPTKTMIRVRKAGEASDFANWSAMFSPAGFRQIGIMAVGIHADRRGKTISYGHGQATSYGSWEVAYDSDRNVIVIGNSEFDAFPEFEMTEKLRAVLAKVNGS